MALWRPWGCGGLYSFRADGRRQDVDGIRVATIASAVRTCQSSGRSVYTPPHMRRTKIVATVGPASRSPEMLERLVRAGVNVLRLNFSHGTQEEHLEVIRAARDIA